MKCATSTLYTQLSLQDAVFMTETKEPNFFSDDDQYANGIDWYLSLYDDAENHHKFLGEASTHYTKMPKHWKSLDRLASHLKSDTKLIYIVRHPIERLISHFIHDWSQNKITGNIDKAASDYEELIAYGRYFYQLQPYTEKFENIAVLNYHYLISQPQNALSDVGAFIGLDSQLKWGESHGHENISSQRLRESRWRDAIVYNKAATWLRHNLIPRTVRNTVKSYWQVQSRPELSATTYRNLVKVFDDDLREFGALIGCKRLNCANFTSSFNFVKLKTDVTDSIK